MQKSTRDTIVGIIEVMKSVYKTQGNQISRKLKNIELINVETLVEEIEKKTTQDKVPQSTEKLVSIIESIIED